MNYLSNITGETYPKEIKRSIINDKQIVTSVMTMKDVHISNEIDVTNYISNMLYGKKDEIKILMKILNAQINMSKLI